MTLTGYLPLAFSLPWPYTRPVLLCSPWSQQHLCSWPLAHLLSRTSLLAHHWALM